MLSIGRDASTPYSLANDAAFHARKIMIAPMPLVSRIVASALALLASLSAANAEAPHAPAKAKQVVVISFDSARETSQWERSRALARRTGAHFTYFLSCVFLLTRETRKEYKPPHRSAGRSNIGFAASKDEVAERLDQIRQAALEGHDIASHGCGHFDGKDWSKADWLAEFAAFKHVLTDAYSINGIVAKPADWTDIVAKSVVGFRAPYLSTGKGLYEALAAAGYVYDASGISRGPAQPERQNGIIRFSLPLIPEGPKGRRVIAMDYNLYARHSGAKEDVANAEEYEERAYRAFRAAFDKQYEGERIPLELGFHFTLMNDGAYWNALERFAGEVCIKSDVACISFKDYAARIDKGQQPPVGG
jgi:peptidoglycan/xylan/chitin deacetylase (PgdA/CDA1 family)